MKTCVAVLVFLCAIPVGAQQPAPAKPPARPAPAQAPAPSVPQQPIVVTDPSADGQPVNIRLDVAITDQKGNVLSQPKTLMVILADRVPGATRAAYEDRSISVDGQPRIIDGKIKLFITVRSQQPDKTGAAMNPDPILNWTNRFGLVLDSGKPIVAFETSDPATARKLSIEVKATLLK